MTATKSKLVPITFNTSEAVAARFAQDMKRGKTQTAIIHEGLRLLGYPVTDGDLADRRGRPRKRQ